MNKYGLINLCGLLILFFAFFVSCTDSRVEKIDKIRKNLNPYKELLKIIKSQNEVDYLLIMGDRYTFEREKIVYSGNFNLEKGKIEQNHYKKAHLTEEDKQIILKWLLFLYKHNISGFDIRNDLISILYIMPDIEMLFLKEHDYEDSWKDQPDKWDDYRGVTHLRLSQNIYVVLER